MWLTSDWHVQSAPKQQADQQPAAALAGRGAFDAAVPPPQLGQASLKVRLACSHGFDLLSWHHTLALSTTTA